MKVVGVRHQVGEFDGKPWENYYIYGVGDQNGNDKVQFYGECPQCVKVKASVLHEVVNPEKIEKLIGREVDFFYDAYKNVTVVNISNK